jgi:hypothetical protein
MQENPSPHSMKTAKEDELIQCSGDIFLTPTISFHLFMLFIEIWYPKI